MLFLKLMVKKMDLVNFKLKIRIPFYFVICIFLLFCYF